MRHNALDKLIGGLARRREDMQDGFVFLSSRASYELVRKAARMNIPLLATISAPTSLAIEISQRAGMRLLTLLPARRLCRIYRERPVDRGAPTCIDGSQLLTQCELVISICSCPMSARR
jgi:formate dehydrogenase accessory protein FdhD